MKSSAPAHMWGIMLILPSLLAGLETTTARKNGIDIYSLTVDSQVSSRFAHTVVTSRVVNRAEAAQEATFQLELPRKAFITNFSMVIDGVTYPGIVQDKAAAQEQYQAAVGRGESAGLVKTAGRQTEQFEVSVTVAPKAKITFELVYQELLRRRLGTYELLLKVKPQQLVKHLQMDIHIFEPQGIRFLETESTFMTQELADALTTSQNKTKAHIRFKPTLSQQQNSQNDQDTILDGNFIVRYDVDRSVSGGSIQIENGYFVHHFAPEDLPTMPKNVIFVIDKSGSMTGRKIQQTREALIKILNDLSPKDQFNLIVFNGKETQWMPSLVKASEENVKEATDYASKIEAEGWTNINDAVLSAVKLLDTSNRAEQLLPGSVSLIILLTDGEPTQGETNPTTIQRNVQEAINNRYSLFCLGFGFNVHYPFLEKLAQDNGGLARRIYEDSDSALQLQDFYQEVANPLLSAVSFEYPSGAVEVLTQDNFRHHFKGSEMVVAGKLQAQGPDVLTAKISGQTHKQNITFQMEASVAQKEEEFWSPKYIYHNFMERLWAFLTVNQQLEQMVSASGAELKALESKALNLSLKYNFVTPLTYMVVTKPEGQEQFQAAGKPVDADNGPRDAFLGGQGHLFKTHIRRPQLPKLKGPRFHTDPRLSVTGSTFRQSIFPGLRGPPGDPHFSARFDSDNFRLHHLQGPDLPPLREPPSFLTHSGLSFPCNLTLTHRGREDTKHKLGKDSCKESRWLGLARPCPKAEPGPRGRDEHLISCGYPHFSVPQPASSLPGPQHCGSGVCCPGSCTAPRLPAHNPDRILSSVNPGPQEDSLQDSLDTMVNSFLLEAALPPPVNEHQASPEQDLVYSEDPLPMMEKEAFPISKVNYVTSATRVPVVLSQAVLQSTKEKDAESATPAEPTHPAPAVILPLPGSSVGQLCVDILRFHVPISLFEDPGQGLWVRGIYEKDGFSRIEVRIQEPHLFVRASPEHVVVTRDQKSSQYKWKQTLFSDLRSLLIVMDKKGFLELSGPDRVTIGVMRISDPQKRLALLVSHAQRFSNRTIGQLGQFYQDIVWDPPVGPDNTTRTLRVLGTEYPATRELKLEYQEGLPAAKISCWTVKI